MSNITIRRATRADVPMIVSMLADDALGGPREQVADPLPDSYYAGFNAVQATPNILLMVPSDTMESSAASSSVFCRASVRRVRHAR